MSEPQDTGTYYRGKRLEDMTRDELINAVINLGRLYSESLERSIGDMRVLSGRSRHG